LNANIDFRLYDPLTGSSVWSEQNRLVEQIREGEGESKEQEEMEEGGC